MQLKTVQRIVWTAAIVGLAVDIATIVIVGFAWIGLSPSNAFGMVTATALMIATVGLQATFIIMQLFPGGRAAVPVGKLGPDGWFYVIVSTAIPGAVWRELAELSFPTMSLVAPRFVGPLLTCVLLLVWRTLQQHRIAAIRE